ncbi:hypothetical protein OH779_30165 [Actinacidiphila glaucinigra]|uniref:hypothetical protein n=1 Tax=Actinacidiphila glaucinigra TaxID=235986 RepID=UPI00386B8926
MDASEALLTRIENDPAAASGLTRTADFDITRRDPIDELRLPSGLAMRPTAGDAAGGTFYLCGEPGDAERPVVYADSEGQAALIGADLTEAMELIVSCPVWWHDVDSGLSPEKLDAEAREDQPDLDRERAELAAALGLTPPPVEEVVARLRATAARTAPDFLPYTGEGDGPYDTYEPMFGP